MSDWTAQSAVSFAIAALLGLVIGWLLAKLQGGREVRKKAAAWKKELEFSRAASTSAAREITRLKSRLTEAEAAFSEASSKLEAGAEQLARRDRTIEKLIAEVNDANSDQARFDELQRRLEEHQRELSAFGRLRLEVEQNRQRLAAAQRPSDELAKCRRRVEELELEHNQLIETETDLTAELSHASSALSALQAQFAEAAMKKDELDETVHQMRSRAQDHPLADEIRSKGEKLEAMYQKLESKQQTIAELRSELEQARSELAECRGQKTRPPGGQ